VIEMAIWIILSAVLVLLLIVGGALLVVLMATSDKPRRPRLPRFGRSADAPADDPH
jgi:flagellar basal body-associated protein FliL